MATLACNIVKGRAVEFAQRVKNGDPAAARLYAIPVDVGVVTDASIVDADDFAAIITLGVTERSANGWNRKTIAAADITALSPDDVNDRYDVDFIDLVWTPTADSTTDIIVCYASVASPTNAQLMPTSIHDWVIVGDGSQVTATVNVYYRAT